MFRRYRPQHARGRVRGKKKKAAAALTLSALAAGPVAWVTVHPGDTLSGIAARYCSGKAGDWTGIWKANRSHVRDPNLIYPGQVLAVRCEDPPAAAGHRAAGKVWGKSYGYPNLCGDGDGDGWDVACQAGHAARRYTSRRPSGPVTVSVFSGADPSGDLSRAQVGQLWLDAGGPGWAEWSAEQVALCESGWNTSAFNPSGATGLWQILGSVIPGNLYDARVNAANAVSKFKASGDTWAQWVCRP